MIDLLARICTANRFNVRFLATSLRYVDLPNLGLELEFRKKDFRELFFASFDVSTFLRSPVNQAEYFSKIITELLNERYVTVIENADLFLLSFEGQALSRLLGILYSYHNKPGRVVIPVLETSKLWKELRQAANEDLRFIFMRSQHDQIQRDL